MKHVFLSMVCVAFLIFTVRFFFEVSAVSDNENDSWIICAEQGKRDKSFYQYDATNDNIYFTYSEYDCIDVYDASGLFQYSFVFTKRQNGSIGVRCVGSRVYISAKDDTVYIFEGTEEIARLSYEEAQAKNYDFSWFYYKDENVTVDKEKICWLNDSGEIVKEISTPNTIRQTIPSSSLGNFPFLGAVMILTLFIPLFIALNKAKVK